MTVTLAETTVDWEHELAALLENLSAAQQELLSVLTEKRGYMACGDSEGMARLHPREIELQDKLEQCYRQRLDLLQRAASVGRPSGSVRQLAASLHEPARDKLGKQVKEAASRSRILQHQSLTNWVLAQRSLLHLSQMLEIIATGGRLQPTYGIDESASPRGALVDHTV